MVHIYTGNGKGKTTAAIGLIVRARGAGLACTLVHFFKPEYSSEDKVLERLAVDIVSVPFKHPIFGNKKEFETYRREYREEMKKVLFEEEYSKYDVIVLDEVLNALDLDLLTPSDLEEFVRRYKEKEIIFTGRTKKLAEIEYMADYLTIMEKVKHPFDRGIGARKGIEH